MSEAEIKAIADRLADLARVLADADPNDKSQIFRQLGLRLTYHPGRELVKAQVMPAECGFFESVRGGTSPKYPYLLSCEFALDDFGGAR
jgi:hypothetical protein